MNTLSLIGYTDSENYYDTQVGMFFRTVRTAALVKEFQKPSLSELCGKEERGVRLHGDY